MYRLGAGVARGTWKSRKGEERRRGKEEKWRRKERRKRREKVKNTWIQWNHREMDLVPHCINYLDPTSSPNKGSLDGVLDP